jgi:hypothetical protein
MKYSRRDLKAVGFLAGLMIRLGILFLVVGAFLFIFSPKIEGSIGFWTDLSSGLFGVICIVLGATLNLRLRRVKVDGDADMNQNAISKQSTQ